MKQFIFIVLLSISLAAKASITITSPALGSTLTSCGTITISYTATVYMGYTIAALYNNGVFVTQWNAQEWTGTFPLPALTPGNNYQLKIYDDYNTSNYAWSSVFNVAAFPVPTATAATNVASSSFQANWTSTSATGYIVTVNGTAYPQTTAIYKVISGLQPLTTYTYTVQAVGSNGCLSAASNPISVTTPACPQLSAPTATAATGITVTSFVANWTAVAGAPGYIVKITSPTTITYPVTTGTSLTLTNLQGATKYTYVVQTASCTPSANSNSISATTLMMATPQVTLSANGGGGNVGGYSWTFGASWPKVSGATSYDIVITANSSSYYSGNTTNINYTWNGDCDLDYGVQVRARNSYGGVTAYSTAQTVGLPCPDSAPVGGGTQQRISSSITSSEKASDAPSSLSASIFPNPAGDVLNVTLPEGIDTKDARIAIHDISGKEIILSAEISNEGLQLSLSGVPSGFYILSITIDDRRYRSKFLKN